MTTHPATNGDVVVTRDDRDNAFFCLFGCWPSNLSYEAWLVRGEDCKFEGGEHEALCRIAEDKANLREALAELARLRGAVEACAVEFETRQDFHAQKNAMSGHSYDAGAEDAYKGAHEIVRSLLVKP